MKNNDKWIALAIWIGLLIALIYTSGFGFGIGSVNSYIRTLLSESNITTATSDQTVTNIIRWGTAGATAVVIVLIAIAWLRFIYFTTELVIALADSTDNVFASLLNRTLPVDSETSEVDEESEIEEKPQTASQNVIGNVVEPLAYTWIVLLAVPLISLALSQLFIFK